jgi:hypothetical protein
MFNDLVSHGAFGAIDLSRDYGESLFRWFSTRGGSDYAIGGIAVGYTVSYLFEAVLNMAFINPKIKIVTWKDTIAPILMKFCITMVAGLAMYLVYRSTDKLLDTSRVVDVVYVLVISSFSGGIVYLVLCYLFQVQELRVYTNKFEALIKKLYARVITKTTK